MKITPFYDEKTATFTYLIIDEISYQCAVIDPVLNYDLETKQITYESIERLLSVIEEKKLTLTWILETHIHADHLTGAYYLQKKAGGKIGIGENVVEVYQHWQPLFNQEIPKPGMVFDKLLKEGELLFIGSLSLKVLKTPGHTPSCVSYQVQNNIFIGDTLFMPDLGTARVDFPGGSAAILYDSIQRLYALDDYIRLYVGHDYPKPGTRPTAHVSVHRQKNNNVMLNKETSLEQYIEKRSARDAVLSEPKLLRQSLKANLLAGNVSEQDF